MTVKESSTLHTVQDMLNIFKHYSSDYEREDCYMLSVSDNSIIGVQCSLYDNNERVMFLEVNTCYSDGETVSVYLEDSREDTAVYKNIVLNNLVEVCEEFAKADFSLQGVKLGSIGKFYKPVNESPVQKISGSDTSDLLNLLQFLQDRGFLKMDVEQISQGRLDDMLDEWHNLPEI